MENQNSSKEQKLDLNDHEIPISGELLFLTKIVTFSGYGYLTGALIGTAKGAAEGLMAAEKGESLKVKTSRVLHTGWSVRRRFGNSIGGYGLAYGFLEGYFGHLRGGADDWANSFLAGVGTGGMYKMRCGLRPAVIGAVVSGTGAALVVTGVKFLSNRFETRE